MKRSRRATLVLNFVPQMSKYRFLWVLLGTGLALDASPVSAASGAPFIQSCDDNAPRVKCGGWSLGGYYSVSPDGYWFAGVSAGGEYFFLRDVSLGASLSPGFGDGYFFLAPSLDLSYYFFEYKRFEASVSYGVRYFYDWPLKKGDAESSGTFHGPGVSLMYGLTRQLYAGGNVSYQWIRFGGESYREWYFTVPAYWLF